ncbi:tyrosine-type recombinase/integrase [Gordonia malaquae]|uniref:tyrosine-type recombinase/integrase n=1 Tax=Gordonia malaquae TaxID=410332 RepID=UPI0030182318
MNVSLTPHELSVTTLALDDFELWQTARRLSRRTIEERLRVIRRFHTETDIQPINAESIDIMRWLTDHDDDWSDGTAGIYAGHLRAFYKYLQIHDRRDDNPMIKVGTPRIAQREPRPVSDRAVIDILQGSMRSKTRAMILLALLAGLRVHEIAKIRGEDFDHRAGLLWVKGKGRKTKSVPLHPILSELAQHMPDIGLWFPRRGYPSEPVHSRSVSQVVGRAIRRAGVNASAHQLRHWYGTTLLDDGVDIRVVQELMRHTSIVSTQNYTAVPQGRQRGAIEGLDPLRGLRRKDRPGSPLRAAHSCADCGRGPDDGEPCPLVA